jgi:hypothetical protein
MDFYCLLQPLRTTDRSCGLNTVAPRSSIRRDSSMGDVTFILAIAIALWYGNIFRILDGKVLHKSN